MSSCSWKLNFREEVQHEEWKGLSCHSIAPVSQGLRFILEIITRQENAQKTHKFTQSKSANRYRKGIYVLSASDYIVA